MPNSESTTHMEAVSRIASRLPISLDFRGRLMSRNDDTAVIMMEKIIGFVCESS